MLGVVDAVADGYSERDNAFYSEWDIISRERGSFEDWMRDNVMAVAGV